MKKILLLSLSLSFIFHSSIGQLIDRSSRIKQLAADSFKIKQNLLKIEREKRRKEMEEESRIDSLRLYKILQDAIKVSKKHLNDKRFSKKYNAWTNDELYQVNVDIKLGYLFSSKNKHILIRRITTHSNLTNVFLIKSTKIIPVLYREQESLEYTGDHIRDVNGDGLKDFLIHWYPNSGCCLRNVYNVYINKNDNGYFTKTYEFINPTFSPKEKIVRGIEYGHPGEVGLYKYKWNGLKIDTIEFIHPDPTNKRKRYFWKTKKNFYISEVTSESEIKAIQKTVIKFVPKEYLKIAGLNWFYSY
jgi:hypothetical protein